AGGGRQGEDRGQGVVQAGVVKINPGDSPGTQLRGPRQVVKGAVGEEPDIDAVHGGGECLGDGCQPADDGGEAFQHSADVEVFGVVAGGLPAEHVCVVGVVASSRSTCSPLVYALTDSRPKVSLNQVRS